MGETTAFGKKFIRIIKGKEYQAKEDIVYQNDIFFAESYAAARDCVYDIVHISEIISAQLREDTRCKYWQDMLRLPPGKLNHFLRGRLNNIIAFCADRGQGKSTAMRSFAAEMKQYIKQRKNVGDEIEIQDRNDFWTDKSKKELPRMRFIECIDPTMMSEKDSIIKVILSRMFTRFSQKDQEKQNIIARSYERPLSNMGEREELLRQFQRCFHDVEILRGEVRHEDWLEEDDLEKMAELGDSSNLLASMYCLIRRYLNYIGSENDYLVIQIDDADMQISKTYQILDDIRRYLLLPNVIILFAANMTQLESTIEQHFLKEFETSLKIPGSMGNLEYCHNMATLYLEKALPVSHRIFLPKLEDHWEELCLEYWDSPPEKENFDKKAKNLLLIPDGKDWRIEKQLLNYLHCKTGMVFLEPKDRYHDFLPTNLRDLVHFLACFEKLDDLKNCYNTVLDIFAMKENEYDRKEVREKVAAWEGNLNFFQDYLVYLWPGTNLREPGRRLFVEFVEEPLFNKHDYLLQNLPDYYSHERRLAGELRGIAVKSEADYRKEFLQECLVRGVEIPEFGNGEERRPASGSYADVMTALSVLGDLFDSSRQAKFIYAVRLYYSICFHQILLKRLNHLDEEPTPEQNITYFMRDAFIKDARENDQRGDFRFWRILVSPRDNIPTEGSLKTWREKKLNQNTANGFDALLRGRLLNDDYWRCRFSKNKFFEDLIRQLNFSCFTNLSLRRRVTDNISVWTCPVETEVSWYNTHNDKYTSEGFVFHPFYRLLRELDTFTYTNKSAPDNDILRGDDSYLRMLYALVVSLNWDVQYSLFTIYWEFKPFPKITLEASLGSYYSSDEIGNLVRVINDLNSDLHWGKLDALPKFLSTFFTSPNSSASGSNVVDLETFAYILGAIFYNKNKPSKTPQAPEDKPSSETKAMQEFISAMVHSIFEEMQKTMDTQENKSPSSPANVPAPSEGE